MHFTKKLFILLAATSLISVAAMAQSATGFIQDFSDVEIKSKVEGKNKLIFFSAPWCKPCQKMKQTTFNNPKLALLAQSSFVPYIANMDYFIPMDLAEKFDVKVFPTVLVINPEGNVVKRFVGYTSAESMFSKLSGLVRTASL